MTAIIGVNYYTIQTYYLLIFQCFISVYSNLIRKYKQQGTLYAST
jgi:hypothetical protein